MNQVRLARHFSKQAKCLSGKACRSYEHVLVRPPNMVVFHLHAGGLRVGLNARTWLSMPRLRPPSDS